MANHTSYRGALDLFSQLEQPVAQVVPSENKHCRDLWLRKSAPVKGRNLEHVLPLEYISGAYPLDSQKSKQLLVVKRLSSMGFFKLFFGNKNEKPNRTEVIQQEVFAFGQNRWTIT